MKAKNLFIFIFITIQLTILAQEETKEHEWEIGIHFSPDYAYRSLSYQAGNNLSSFLLNKRDSLEVSDFRFTTGLSFRYRLSKRFFLETGLYYSSKGFQTQWVDSFISLQTSDPFIPEKSKTRDQFHYLEVPLKAYFMVYQKERLQLFVAPAIISSYLITYDYTVFYQYSNRLETKEIATNENFNYFNFNYSISAGINYTISKRSKFQFEPTFRKSINSVIDAPIKARLWSLGLNFGFYLSI